MRFEELPLYEAVYHARREMENPGSDQWTLHRQEELCRRVLEHLPIGSPFTQAQILDAWVKYRKAPGNKVELTVLTAMAHGTRCFYANRGKGDCSDAVDVDRLVPGSRGGEYAIENCVLTCSFHNRQRSDRPLEDYLTS